jgi:hypothetical protein
LQPGIAADDDGTSTRSGEQLNGGWPADAKWSPSLNPLPVGRDAAEPENRPLHHFPQPGTVSVDSVHERRRAFYMPEKYIAIRPKLRLLALDIWDLLSWSVVV